MICSLVCSDIYYSTFLEKIADDIGSSYCMVISEEYLHIFSKTTWVVIPYCLCITKSLEQGIAGQDFILYWVTLSMTEIGEHFHTIFCWLCLSCSWFSRDNNSLFALTTSESLKSFPCNHIDMRRSFEISTHNFVSDLRNNLVIEVSLNDFIGIDNDESWTYVCEYLVFFVPFNDIPENFRFIKYVHFAHIWMKLSLWHLVCLLICCSDHDFTFWWLCFELYLIVIKCFERNSLQKGDSQIFISRRAQPSGLGVVHSN